MRKLAYSLLAILVWGPCPLSALPLEIAPNGSFEEDRNRDGLPDGWKQACFDSPARAEWDRSQGHTGSCSVKISDSLHPERKDWNANAGRWVLQRARAVTPGETVSASSWVKSELTAGAAYLTLSWSSDKKWLHEDSSPGVAGTQDWTQVEVSAQAPEGATTVSVYLRLPAARGSAWFDDVRASHGGKVAGNFRSVDLRSACNVGFRDEKNQDGTGGWTDQGDNDLRNLPLGAQTFRGVPFEIVDPAANAGKSAVVLSGKGRTDVASSVRVPVGLCCDTLYFLHACAWAGREGTPVGTYTVRYADGEEREIPLRTGVDVTDWWKPADCENCAAGWRGTNPHSGDIGLGILPWVNPRPQETIDSVTARTSGTGPNLMLVALTAGDGRPSFPELPLDYRFTDTKGWYEWNFPVADPSLGELDLSRLLDAPAGKHGFSKVSSEGCIVFEDGTRGRFFGTNVGGSRCAPPREEAEIQAARLAAYGVNLLRLHTIDSRWSDFLEYGKGNTRSFNPEALDRMDYFVAQLKKRGIYVYFDLLDYRGFLPGDDVRDADKMDTHWTESIKGASIFNRRMIELQKEFATQLLTHRNPYTGLRYVDEPALLIQEITNENSLFYLSNPQLILPSYTAELKDLWNRWLGRRYGDRAKLADAWRLDDGTSALTADENPEAGTVAMPTQHLYRDTLKAGSDPMRAAPRLNDLTRFLYETEVAYYTEMMEHLRGLGLKCLITGTNQDFSDASNRANACCQAMTRNNYWCHPDVHAKPFNRFRNLSVLASPPHRTATPMANIASSAVAGKPMISPEFNFPWPNEFRAECLPMMMAYACLQDWDGMLFFAYDTRPERGRLSYFGNTRDPARWGQVPLAALMFLRGDVATARTTVHIGVSTVDTFATRDRRTSDRYSPYCILPYISKVRSAYFDTRYEGDADLVLSSGHSAAGDYSQARRAIVFADSAAVNESGLRLDRGASARATLPGLRTATADNGWTTILPESCPAGAEILKLGELDAGVATDRFYLLPSASQAAPDGGGVWLHRRLLDAFNRWNMPGAAPLGEAGQIYRSDTGEIVLNSEQRLFTVVAPRVRVAVGFFGTEQVKLGDTSLTCRTPFAAVSAIALDDVESLSASSRVLVTAVARAENTGQATIRTRTADRGIDADTGAFLPQSTIAITEPGRPPVLAEPVDASLRLPCAVRQAYALDERGQKTRSLPLREEADSVVLDTREAHSPWILLER